MAVDTIRSPFDVVIDDREKLRFGFPNIKGDARDGHKRIEVATRIQRLLTGDYTFGLPDGPSYENEIVVERKSLGDGYSTFIHRRTEFEAELERANELKFAAVVLECSWHQLAYEPPPQSRINPKCVMRSIFAWMQRYPRVHWLPMGSRAMAEVTTYRLLERFYRDRLRAEIAEAVA